MSFFSKFSVICDFWCFVCDFFCDFVIFVCDFFVISREMYKKESVICSLKKTCPKLDVTKQHLRPRVFSTTLLPALVNKEMLFAK